MTTWTKGQQVQVLAGSNGRYRGKNPWSEGTITTVGRKYIHVLDCFGHTSSFRIDDGVEVVNYSGSARRIFTPETRAEYDRREAVRTGLSDLRLLDVWNRVASLEAKEAILAIAQADKAAQF